MDTWYTILGNKIEANTFSLKDLMETIRQFRVFAKDALKEHKFGLYYYDARDCKKGDYDLHKLVCENTPKEYTPASTIGDLTFDRLRELGLDIKNYFKRNFE